MADRDPENDERCLSCGHRPDMCECACCWGTYPEAQFVLCPYCRRHVFTRAYREHKRVHHPEVDLSTIGEGL
jgi:hypothetical protein